MSPTDVGDPTYVFGRSDHETRRLEQQAKLFEPSTRLLFQEAGIATGMNVLDVGCGPGDVAFLVADPVATLRSAVRALRDDGVAAFYEPNLTAGVASFPVSPLHQLLGRCLCETFARGGADRAMGLKLHQVFRAAGLAAPRLHYSALIGGQVDWVERFAHYGANTLRSLLPLTVAYGVATEEEIGIETFERRYREEVIGQGSVVRWIPFVGAWARKPRAA